jgi:DNA-binding CsgD family transcriptional regulator
MRPNAAFKSWPAVGATAPERAVNSISAWSSASLGAFEAFAVACDRARTPKAAGRLLISAAQALGFDKVALTTHGELAKLGSLGVLEHNWGDEAAALLRMDEPDVRNPLFEEMERTFEPVRWSAAAFRARLDAAQAVWMERLGALGLRNGVSQRVRTAIVPASCSLTSDQGEPDPANVCRVMRAAAYAFHHIVALQRPRFAQPDLLTLREQQCLAMATLSGLRPREVAEELSVSVNTVRTIRQSACMRLGARSCEEAVWRMVESGQLFLRGRTTRPRSW